MSAFETPPRRQRDWNAAAAVIASLIGLLALCVSGYTAWLQRQQVRAQVWPYLQTGISRNRQMMLLENKGVGPAQVRGMHVYVDGKPQTSWPKVFDALGLSDLRDTPPSTINGIVISPGEEVQQMNIAQQANFDRFFVQYTRIQLQLCYCSALDECWLFDERVDDPKQRRTPLAACPVADKDEFIDNRLPPPGDAGDGARR